MKKFLHIACRAVAAVLVLALVGAGGFYLWLQDKYVVPIMMYHSVQMKGKDLQGNVNVAAPDEFRRDMDVLKKYGYNVISLRELVDGTKSGKKFPRNSVVITFDDGYIDNYEAMFPILKEYGFPATIFLLSDLVGQEEYFSWEQAREMQASGLIEFGSHTRDHAYLPDQPAEKQRDEIFTSKRIIERELGGPVNYFSYPGGGFTPAVKDMVKEAGYAAAVTTNRGSDQMNRDVYELKRIRFGKENQNDFSIRAKLFGFYNVFRKERKPY